MENLETYIKQIAEYKQNAGIDTQFFHACQIAELALGYIKNYVSQQPVSNNEVAVCPDCNGLGYYVNGIYTPECERCNGTGQTDC